MNRISLPSDDVSGESGEFWVVVSNSLKVQLGDRQDQQSQQELITAKVRVFFLGKTS